MGSDFTQFVSVLMIEIEGMLHISLVAVMLQWWLVDY